MIYFNDFLDDKIVNQYSFPNQKISNSCELIMFPIENPDPCKEEIGKFVDMILHSGDGENDSTQSGRMDVDIGDDSRRKLAEILLGEEIF